MDSGVDTLYLEGNYIDVVKGEIYPAKITFSEKIEKIQRTTKKYDNYISPGFIDSHIRFEDSLLSPIEYTKLALLSGITSVVEDLSGFMTSYGSNSIKYLVSEFNKLPIDFHYLFPLNAEISAFETGPEKVVHDDFLSILKNAKCLGLTQVDDVKKIEDSVFLKKINLAKSSNKPIISNIPKVHFTKLGSFAQMGIRADIGSNIYQEAFEKACFGLKIKIVEGTKRKTLANLIRLAKQFDTTIVSEEKSVHDLMKGYLSTTLKKAISLGLDPITAIKNVTLNPAKLIGLNEGYLGEGSVANIVELGDLKSFNVTNVFYKGKPVVKDGKLVVLKKEECKLPKFKIDLIDLESDDLAITSSKHSEKTNVLVLNDLNDETTIETVALNVENGVLKNKLSDDILKVVVASSYGENVISVGYVKGFNLTKGAFGTNRFGSSGNLIAVGTSDEDIALTLNLLTKSKGGFVAVDSKRTEILGLPIYGVCSELDSENLVEMLKKLNQFVKRLGFKNAEPFETLGALMNTNKSGFRITDKGLLNVSKGEFVDVLID